MSQSSAAVNVAVASQPENPSLVSRAVKHARQVLLVFDDVEKENRFLLFSYPAIKPIAFGAFIVLFLIFSTLFAISDSGDSRAGHLITFGISTFIAALNEAMILLAQSRGWLSPLIRIRWMNYSLLALFALATFGLTIWEAATRGAECTHVIVFGRTGTAAKYRYCNHYYPVYMVIYTIALYARHVRLVLVVPAVVCGLLGIVLINGIMRQLDSTAASWITFNIFLNGFILFLHRRREQGLRRVIEIAERLDLEGQALTRRRNELTSYCMSVLPEVVVDRSRFSNTPKTLDQTEEGAVLAISVHDFAVECTRQTPAMIAGMLESVVSFITDLAVERGLHRVTVVHDEVIIVGNLLVRREALHSLTHACEVGFFAVHVKDDLNPLPPLCAAVSAGHLVGGFVGSRFVRYDVFGEAVTTARSALRCAKKGTAVLTDIAYHECRDYINAEEDVQMDDWTPKIHLWRITHVDTKSLPQSLSSELAGRIHSNGLLSTSGLLRGGSDSTQRTSLGRVMRRTSYMANNSNHSASQQLSEILTPTLMMTPETVAHSGPGSVSTATIQSASWNKPGSPIGRMDMDLLTNVNNNVPAEQLMELEAMVEADPIRAAMLFKSIPEDQQMKKIEQSLRVRRIWRMFYVFKDPLLEAAYCEYRRVAQLRFASGMWMAFSWVLNMYWVLMIPEADTTKSTLAGSALVGVCALLSAGIGVFSPKLVPEAYAHWFPAWSVLTCVTPCIALFGCALSRPNIVSNNIGPLFVLGALLRSASFIDARHYVTTVPAFFLIEQLHLLLPHPAIRLADAFYFLLVLVSVAYDHYLERTMRINFANEKRYEAVVVSLRQERSVREGLVRSTMPKCLEEEWKRTTAVIESTLSAGSGAPLDQIPEGPRCITVSDTSILLVRWRGTLAEVENLQRDWLNAVTSVFNPIEEIIAEFPLLSITKIFGDHALIVGPVVASNAQLEEAEKNMHQCLCDATNAMLRLAKTKQYDALLDHDSTIQCVRLDGLPSHTVMGAGVTRVVTVAAAVDREALKGALVTSRALTLLQNNNFFDINVVEQAMPRWRIRGAGQMRLTRLALGSPSVGPSSVQGSQPPSNFSSDAQEAAIEFTFSLPRTDGEFGDQMVTQMNIKR